MKWDKGLDRVSEWLGEQVCKILGGGEEGVWCKNRNR